MHLFKPSSQRTALLLSDLALFVVALTVLVLSYDYAPRVRIFPVLVCWTMILLVLVDVVAQTRTRVGNVISRVIGREDEESSNTPTQAGTGRRVVFALVWIPAFGLATYLLGFLVTSVLYMFISMVVLGNARPLKGAISGALLGLFVWIFFEAILGFSLFNGILLAPLLEGL